MTATAMLRLSAVSFFNTAPLVYGLDREPSIRIRFGVPSTLLGDLESGSADVALLPVIDYQRMDGLRIIPATGIGCDGPTLTVRLFSRTPIAQTRILAADTDSHTSVVLARIILQNRFGSRPTTIPLDQASDTPGETRLLIGDKVVTDEPIGFDHQLDLGQAWKDLTGLPFTFAIWTARDGVEIGELAKTLTAALESGLTHVDQLVDHHAVPRGWPVDVAKRYLQLHLRFRMTPPHLEAIRRFHAMAYELGLIDRMSPLRFA